jgi:hypothetical protein
MEGVQCVAIADHKNRPQAYIVVLRLLAQGDVVVVVLSIRVRRVLSTPLRGAVVVVLAVRVGWMLVTPLRTAVVQFAPHRDAGA